jgi:hypothetical protein
MSYMDHKGIEIKDVEIKKVLILDLGSFFISCVLHSFWASLHLITVVFR